MKKLLGILVLAAAVWLGLELSPSAGESAVSATPTQWTSSAQCKACHEEVYAEWEDSWHAKSWIDEDVRVQSADFSNKICIDCHAPRPVFETGVGNRVLPRSSRRAEGVDCISCHLLPDGSIAGTIDNPSAPCRPVARRELQRVAWSWRATSRRPPARPARPARRPRPCRAPARAGARRRCSAWPCPPCRPRSAAPAGRSGG